MTPAAHQKQLDDAGDIETIKARIEREMKAALMAMDEYDLDYRKGVSVLTDSFGGWVVVDEMATFDTEAMETGIALLDEDPIEGAQWLMAYKERCVNQIVGRAKIDEAAAYELEQSQMNRAFPRRRVA